MDAKKILIIEDEHSIAEIIKFNLSKEGFEIEQVCCGRGGGNATASPHEVMHALGLVGEALKHPLNPVPVAEGPFAKEVAVLIMNPLARDPSHQDHDGKINNKNLPDRRM